MEGLEGQAFACGNLIGIAEGEAITTFLRIDDKRKQKQIQKSSENLVIRENLRTFVKVNWGLISIAMSDT